MDWATSDLTDRNLYKLLVNTVLPRPIALVTTVDGNGNVNAAPFSFFNIFSHAPPLVVLGIEGREPAEAPLKDTMRNIRTTGSFVVNLVDRALVEAMTICAIDLPSGIDELAAAGLTSAPSRQVAAPRIAASPVQLECRETVSLSLGTRHRNLVVGEIVHLHIRDGLVDEQFPCRYRRAGSRWPPARSGLVCHDAGPIPGPAAELRHMARATTGRAGQQG